MPWTRIFPKKGRHASQSVVNKSHTPRTQVTESAPVHESNFPETSSTPAHRTSLKVFPKNQIYGIRPLYSPKDISVDIVFVHGLTGNSYSTWLDPDTEVYWPVHLLSKDFPHARILAFGYDADVTKFIGPVGQSNLREHASALIADLANLRTKDNSADRKIIVVAHSLGGLVIKKAICLSEQETQSHLKQLEQQIIAVAFMGTPHRGSDLAQFATGVANILKASGKRLNKGILQLLKRNSEVLADVEESFSIWLRKNADRFSLTCFFEELELPAVGMVVSKESAKIGGWPYLPIHANHMDMTKFATLEDTGYRRISGELRRWVDLANKAAG
ncbi:hypothetical protein AnigIFM50267_009900 [Aspergillus niger]|nr:hypothetical protein AnigIFM50267_009900 [Aspergillus niger]